MRARALYSSPLTFDSAFIAVNAWISKVCKRNLVVWFGSEPPRPYFDATPADKKKRVWSVPPHSWHRALFLAEKSLEFLF